ncbi:MAG TPA: Gldg family protein [Chloroflexota bacterium]|nr:Gldg family protein [Chloroflexota bacterium]
MVAWFERIRFPVLILGIIALAAAAVWYFIQGYFDTPQRLLLIVGVLLVGIYVAIEPGEVVGAIGSRGARYGGNTLLVIVVFLGILGLLNFVSIRHSQRWDVTASGVNTLSDQTQKVLDGLPQPVHVTAFINPDDRGAPAVETLLRNYEASSNGKLTWESVDPVTNLGMAQQFGIRTYNTIVFQMGDKRQDSTGLTESDFTSALIKLTAAVQPKVYFLTGHGEHSPDAQTQDGYSEMKRNLTSENYQVDTLNLATQGSVPDDAAVLVIASPRNPLLPEETKAINDYLDRAGHVFLMVDPRTASNVADIVQRWGITFSNGLVFDPASAFQRDPRAPVVVKYGLHKVTESLARDNLPIVLVEATSINVPDSQQQGVTITKLAETSGDRSYVKPLDAQGTDYVEGEDTKGPVTLAVAVEADAPNAPAASGDQASGDQAGATPATPTAADKPKMRAVIVGDSDYPSNGIEALVSAFGGNNRDFFMNSVGWLGGSDALAAIRPKPPEQRPLFLGTAQRNTIIFGTMILLPLLILVAGGLVWWGRR